MALTIFKGMGYKEYVTETVCGPQNITYLPSSALQKNTANSRFKG